MDGWERSPCSRQGREMAKHHPEEPEQPTLPTAEPEPPPRCVGQGEEQFGGSMAPKGFQAHPGWMGMAKALTMAYISSSGSVLGAGLVRTQIRGFHVQTDAGEALENAET